MRSPALALRHQVVARLALDVIATWAPPLRAELSACALRVKERVDAEDLARGATPDMRGYYWGEQDESQCPDRLEQDPGLSAPPQIVLFASNIEPSAEAVETVLMHELGHHVGFDELELVEGLGLI